MEMELFKEQLDKTTGVRLGLIGRRMHSLKDVFNPVVYQKIDRHMVIRIVVKRKTLDRIRKEREILRC